MQFLKTLFWVALAVVLVLFASVNWTSVTITLWGGLEADVKLPMLVFAAFLAGFLPMLVLHRARMWSQRRRIEQLERQSALQQAPAVTPQETADVNPVPETVETSLVI
ncbi:MAG: DUF1049 domain-containing protein [Sphingosinicella sp.]|nr:DUF1049 domain-containing protein [Sphingosinicella sp.]